MSRSNMKKNKSEIIIILDRSGSMESIKDDMEGGLKTFIDKQRDELGECFVSLYQFDTKYEPVFEYKNIDKVEKINISPRGNTALNDAIGRTINTVGDRLQDTPENNRPDSVIFVIISDGQENASTEFNQSQIKKMVTHQESKYNWRFKYLGANQDAVLTGSSYGFSKASSLTYSPTKGGIIGAFACLSDATSYMRSTNCNYAFTEEERKAALVKN